MSAVLYVLLYGRRSIQEDAVRAIVIDDVMRVQSKFERVISRADMDDSMKDLRRILDVMLLPTDTLIQYYTQDQSPLPLPILARIIAARSGKSAQKLIDKIRGK